MCQNGSCFIGKRGSFQNASKKCLKCVKNARNTFGGEHLLDDTDFCPVTLIFGGEVRIILLKISPESFLSLVAPYCAIPRDYLSDTHLLRAMGFLVSQHGQLGAIPPPPFLSVSTLEYMRSRGAIPPQKGYLSDTSAIPCEYKANGCDTPLCDTISKGYCAIWGGISHWAAKFLRGSTVKGS